jgi:hypothetical protein
LPSHNQPFAPTHWEVPLLAFLRVYLLPFTLGLADFGATPKTVDRLHMTGMHRKHWSFDIENHRLVKKYLAV